MKPLFIIIKKKYLDEIAAGIKTEEFRLTTPYWTKRLVDQEYSHIIFQAGYSLKSDRLSIEYNGYQVKNMNHEFFGEQTVQVYALQLGSIIESKLDGDAEVQ